MVGWLRELNAKERKTMWGCFGGWSLDAFDVQMYSFVIPTVISLWGLSRGEAGLIGTVTLLISSLGGWFSGTLADKFGRVKMLQITILWYSFFTFLCAFAINFETLFALRALHGLGFGGEWAAGAVLMGEVVRDKYRGRAVGLVQTGWAVGWGAAAIVYTALYWMLPESIAWRVLFGIGLLPAVFVFWVRRHIDEPEIFKERAADRAQIGTSHLFAAFRGPHFWTTVKVSLMVAGAQGGGYALSIWMPTYLRTVRGLSSTSTGGFLIVQILGALVGFLIGSYLADYIGRKGTFVWSAVASFVMVLVFLLVPMDNTALFWLGIPSPADEAPADGTLYDRAVPDRDSRHRAGLLLQCRACRRLAVSGDGRVSEPGAVAWHLDRDLQRHRLRADARHAAAVAGNAWPQACNFGDRGGRRSIVVACLFAELTISATADLALLFLNVVPATFREWRRSADERKFCPP